MRMYSTVIFNSVLVHMCHLTSYIDLVTAGRYGDPHELPELVVPLILTAVILIGLLVLLCFLKRREIKAKCCHQKAEVSAQVMRLRSSVTGTPIFQSLTTENLPSPSPTHAKARGPGCLACANGKKAGITNISQSCDTATDRQVHTLPT